MPEVFVISKVKNKEVEYYFTELWFIVFTVFKDEAISDLIVNCTYRYKVRESKLGIIKRILKSNIVYN